MKKLIFIALFIGAAITGFSREYEPTEGWPYLYHDFKPAIVYFNDGKAESANINVHLISNELHFTDSVEIKVVRDKHKIDSVVCEDKTILFRRGNKYVTAIYKTEYVLIGTTCECDINALTDRDGAYGSPTTTAATQSLSSLRDYGTVAVLRFNELTKDKYNTRPIPTINQTVMVVNNRALCQATKRGVSELLTREQKKEFNKFIKDNKIKWKDLNCLILVAQFLDQYIKDDTLIL